MSILSGFPLGIFIQASPDGYAQSDLELKMFGGDASKGIKINDFKLLT